MKTLIIYASKYGCTADCASNLKNILPGDVSLFDINDTTAPPALDGFDTIAIGGSVYIGKIAKKLRAFCDRNLTALLEKRLGIFLCCALEEDADKFFAANFASELLKHSKTTEVFGSDARLEKMSFFDKSVIKAVTKGDFSNFKISHERIETFAQELTK